jgi:hypothetical protein
VITPLNCAMLSLGKKADKSAPRLCPCGRGAVAGMR